MEGFCIYVVLLTMTAQSTFGLPTERPPASTSPVHSLVPKFNSTHTTTSVLIHPAKYATTHTGQKGSVHKPDPQAGIVAATTVPRQTKMLRTKGLLLSTAKPHPSEISSVPQPDARETDNGRSDQMDKAEQVHPTTAGKPEIPATTITSSTFQNRRNGKGNPDHRYYIPDSATSDTTTVDEASDGGHIHTSNQTQYKEALNKAHTIVKDSKLANLHTPAAKVHVNSSKVNHSDPSVLVIPFMIDLSIPTKNTKQDMPPSSPPRRLAVNTTDTKEATTATRMIIDTATQTSTPDYAIQNLPTKAVTVQSGSSPVLYPTKTDVTTQSVEQDTRLVEWDTASAEQNTASVEHDTRSVEQDTETVEQYTSPVEQDARSLEQDTQSVEQDTSSVEQDTRSVEQDTPSIEQDTPSLEQDTQSVEQDNRTNRTTTDITANDNVTSPVAMSMQTERKLDASNCSAQMASRVSSSDPDKSAKISETVAEQGSQKRVRNKQESFAVPPFLEIVREIRPDLFDEMPEAPVSGPQSQTESVIESTLEADDEVIEVDLTEERPVLKSRHFPTGESADEMFDEVVEDEVEQTLEEVVRGLMQLVGNMTSAEIADFVGHMSALYRHLLTEHTPEENPTTTASFLDDHLFRVFNESDYSILMVQNATTWEKAREWCSGQKGGLLVLDSQDNRELLEMAFSRELAKANESTSVWIGHGHHFMEDYLSMRQSSGEQFPTETRATTKACPVFTRNENWTFEVGIAECTQMLPFVCEVRVRSSGMG